MITVHILYVVAVGVVCYAVGAFVTYILYGRNQVVGDLFFEPSDDQDGTKVIFKFNIMPDDLENRGHIVMRVHGKKHNSHNDRI